MSPNLPPILPTGRTSGGVPVARRAQPLSFGKLQQRKEQESARVSANRAFQRDGSHATTSVQRVGDRQKAVTSLSRTQHALRSVAHLGGYEEEQLAGDEDREEQRYRYAQYKIRERKMKEQMAQIKKIRQQFSASSKQVLQTMESLVDTYGHLKPLDGAYRRADLKKIYEHIDAVVNRGTITRDDAKSMKTFIDRLK